MKKLYGSGYRNCYGGITWGYSLPIGKDTEMVFLEYRRIPEKHNRELVVKALTEKHFYELKNVGDKNINETSGFGKKIDRRMKKWMERFAKQFESWGKK